jgi:hypothetical protein
MTTPVAGELETRVRKWLSSYNQEKLSPEDIYALMNEAGNELVQLFDIWFCKVWGSVTRDADNAAWDTRSIPPPLRENGALLSAAEIASGDVPVNVSYLRAVPYPDGLQRPYKAYYGSIDKANELAYLMEDEFEETYDFEQSGATPEAYALSGDSILLGHAPSFDVTLWVQGFYLPVQLEDDLDENEFTRHGHTLLVYATQNLIIKYNYEEEERAGLFKEEYGRALRAALAQTGRTGDVARQSRFQRKG